MSSLIVGAVWFFAVGFYTGWKWRQSYIENLEREYDHVMDEFEKVCREHSRRLGLAGERHGGRLAKTPRKV
jgi:hypothetical protein